jgi:hypothetical protein
MNRRAMLLLAGLALALLCFEDACAGGSGPGWPPPPKLAFKGPGGYYGIVNGLSNTIVVLGPVQIILPLSPRRLLCIVLLPPFLFAAGLILAACRGSGRAPFARGRSFVTSRSSTRST